jgi:hypothetical protein
MIVVVELRMATFYVSQSLSHRSNQVLVSRIEDIDGRVVYLKDYNNSQ